MEYSQTTLNWWAGHPRMLFSATSTFLLSRFLREFIVSNKDIYKILFMQLLLSRIVANVIYFISAFSYIISLDPTKTCPYVPIFDIMNDYFNVALTLLIAYTAGRRNFRDFITEFRFFLGFKGKSK